MRSASASLLLLLLVACCAAGCRASSVRRSLRVAAVEQVNTYDESSLEGPSNYDVLKQLSNVVAVHLVNIPGTDRFLYMERPSGYHPDKSRNIIGTFDLVTREWVPLSTPDSLFCAGHAVMSNGSVIIAGGHIANAGWPAGIQSIRTFSDGDEGLTFVTMMHYARWYPSVTLLPDSKILISGGTQGVGAGTTVNPVYEIWDPETPSITQELPVEPSYLRAVRANYYPFNYVLPTGDVFNYCSRWGWIMDPYLAKYKVAIPTRIASVVSPGAIYHTQFPFTGTSVMLALDPANDYAAEVLVFGGADVKASGNLTMDACSESIRIKITWSEDGKYSFNGGWVQELMGGPRVMPDATLLPNGMVILMNGAQRGLAGDSASGGDSRTSYPNFFAELYDPEAPVGQRYSTLARSQVARLYHSVAALTTNGTILVSGCDRCAKIVTDMQYEPAPVKAEYRNEIFYPPYFFDDANKPKIEEWDENIFYDKKFTVKYTGETNPDLEVTSAVLVAPSSTTHSFNTNQRVVRLVMAKDQATKTLTLMAPPTPNHAPPQKYMLFLLNGRTYSKAKWVMLSNK